MPFSRDDISWMWLGMALCLWSLAPHLAPREFVSKTNVRMPRTRFGHEFESSDRRLPWCLQGRARHQSALPEVPWGSVRLPGTW